MVKPFKRHFKFGNTRTYVDGLHFASKLEAAVYGRLKLLQSGGEIENIRCQRIIHLTRAEISYKTDFIIYDKQLRTDVAVEAKGFVGERWRIILDLYRVYGPYPLWIYKGDYLKPKRTDVIYPLDWKNSCNIQNSGEIKP